MSGKKYPLLFAIFALLLTMLGLGTYFGLQQRQDAHEDRVRLSQTTLFFLALGIGFLFVPLVGIIIGFWIASLGSLLKIYMADSAADKIGMFCVHGAVTAAALKLTHVLVQIIGRSKEMTRTLDQYFQQQS